MKAKTFVILLMAAGLLAVVVALRLGGGKPTGEMRMGDKLFADLPMDQVALVTIADAKHRVTLRQGETTWQVAERSGYPADFGALRDTVIKLSRLKIGRRFAGTPESLVRLSLMAPTATTDKGRGQSITLKDAQGKVLADVILGQVRKTEGGGAAAST
ncbi:hypothetical protein [Desulfosarcina cetonica]|uniref:hypothetical protein n=1 Tax=Desulfosarcina cetonica TaxID=90730 RepID=UPI0006CFC3A8|nr:hypothetical protein [Desulfosarcina cetonica]